jgi:arylsulfatase A-like enzyme
MFTGLYPSQHQADWGHVYLDRSFPTLAGRLRDIGYETVGFSENVFVGRTFGLARGFEEFHETWRRPLVVRALARIATRVFGYRDRLDCPERTIGLFERWVGNNRNRGKPFFAFFNFMSAHLPRYPRPGFGRQNWPKGSLARIQAVNLIPERFYVPRFHLDHEDLAVMADVYDSDLSFLDSQIGHLMDFLTKKGLLDNTVVILTSDHGENFGEHGFIEHQLCLYNTLLHVPLIVRYPGVVKAGRIEGRVSTVSLFNTVLALVRASRGDGHEGSRVDPLAGLEAQDSVVSECANAVGMLKGALGSEGRGLDLSHFDRSLKCITKGTYKFIWSSDGKNELYRIEEDPGEMDNVIEKEPDWARVLSQLLTSWEMSTPKRVLF